MNHWDPNQQQQYDHDQQQKFHDQAAQNGGIQFGQLNNGVSPDGVGAIYTQLNPM